MSETFSQPPLVLVVEDEPILRMNAAEILESQGYEVIEAGDAASALAIIADRPDVRVLFTDINMPGAMDGLDLAREVHARWPNVLLLITSGRELMSNADIPDDGVFVAKPYGAERLVARIRGLISNGHSGRSS